MELQEAYLLVKAALYHPQVPDQPDRKDHATQIPTLYLSRWDWEVDFALGPPSSLACMSMVLLEVARRGV
jgi:hypothetical protein